MEEERYLIRKYHLGVVAGSTTLMAWLLAVPVGLPSAAARAGKHRLVFGASLSPSQQHSEALPQHTV
jgi:hypothetical protein